MTTPDYIHGGFDLGRSNDFSAFATVAQFGHGDEARYEIDSTSYTCEERGEELKTAQFTTWIDAGHLIEHPGNAVSYSEIEDAIVQTHKAKNVRTWAYDPNFAGPIGQNLIERLGVGVPFEFTQSAKYYNVAIREFQKAVNQRRVVHNGNPCQTWQICNLQIKRNAKDEWMPDKSASQFKIDAGVAILMALSECQHAEKHQPIVYNKRGILTL